MSTWRPPWSAHGAVRGDATAAHPSRQLGHGQATSRSRIDGRATRGLICTDDLLAELGGQEVAAVLAGEPIGEAILSIHVATDGEADAALQEAVRAGGVVVKRAAPTPLGGSYGFFAGPDGHVLEVIHHPDYHLAADGRPEIP
jgi:hypothetical protein